MTLPRAVLLIRFQSLSNLPSLSSADRPYVIAKVGSFVLGRSRPIPLTATSFDLTAEPSLWEHEVADHGSGVRVEVEIWNDRGDSAPQRLATATTTVRPTSPALHRFGSGPEVTCQVYASILPQDSEATVAAQRVPGGGGGRTHAVPTHEAAVAFETIEGLYKPGVHTPGLPHPRASGYQPGYASEDHEGRIFINRDLNGRWTRQQQSIRLTVAVHAIRGSLPPGAKVLWEVEVPDNPINDHTDTHRSAGPVLDAGDYDANGVPLGFDANDNEGTVHAPRSAQSTAPWEEVSGFSLSDTSATSAKTTIDQGRSSVVLHCPNTNGDRLVVRANVVSPGLHSYPARTGIMTMWRRIDVEYIRMRSAPALPINTIPQYFEPACVQLDFTAENVVRDRAFIARNAAERSRRSTQYIRSVFRNSGTPGWFCLVSALRDLRRIPPPFRRVQTTGTITQNGGTDVVTLVGAHSDVMGVKLRFGTAPHRRQVAFQVYGPRWLRIDPATGARTVVTQASQATHTECQIVPHEITPTFVHGDGEIDASYRDKRLYYPQREGNESVWFPGRPGFGVPNNVEVEVVSGDPPGASGISPTVPRGSGEYFAGQTMLFNANRHSRDYVISAIVHELTHAFGMPHICGHHDYRTPRRQACAMNYEDLGLVDDNNLIIADNANNTGPWMCALHLREIRRTRLEDNLGLRW